MSTPPEWYRCAWGGIVALILSLPAAADEVSSLARKAQGYSDEGRYELAFPAWEAVVVKAKPSEGAEPSQRYINALIEAGISASMIGKYEIAKTRLERAVELSPRNPKALLNLGLFYIREKKYQLAENLLHKTLEVDPNQIDANLHLGMIAEARGDLALAKEYYIKEVNIMGGTPRAWARLFSLQAREKRPAPISMGHALLFCMICLLAAGGFIVVYRLRELKKRTMR